MCVESEPSSEEVAIGKVVLPVVALNPASKVHLVMSALFVMQSLSLRWTRMTALWVTPNGTTVISCVAVGSHNCREHELPRTGPTANATQSSPMCCPQPPHRIFATRICFVNQQPQGVQTIAALILVTDSRRGFQVPARSLRLRLVGGPRRVGGGRADAQDLAARRIIFVCVCVFFLSVRPSFCPGELGWRGLTCVWVTNP